MRNTPLKAFATPLKQTTPPKTTYRGKWKEKLGIGKKKVKTYTAPGDGPTYHYDRHGNVKKVVEEGKVTKYKKGHRRK